MSSGVLAEAIEGVEIGLDPTALVAVMGLRDRLDAKIAAAVAELDAAGLWNDDGRCRWRRGCEPMRGRRAARRSASRPRRRGCGGCRRCRRRGPRVDWRAGTVGHPASTPHTPTDRHPAPPGAPAGAISANGPACVVPAAVS